jgi:tetratricopeptide (TPR) repeat protein
VGALLADLAMVERLEEIRLQQSQVKADGSGFDFGGADAAYARAFRDYGLDVEASGPGAGEWLGARSIAVELAAALDDWAQARWEEKGEAEGTWKLLLAVARAADPDPLRTQVRQALEARDQARLNEVAKAAAGAGLSATTLVAVAKALRPTDLRSEGQAQDVGLAARAVGLLREGQRRYPGDFWVNHQLAFLLMEGKPSQPEEAIRFYTAALALRPQSPGVYLNLGNALRAKGRLEEAEAADRKAIELKPDYTAAHNNLGNALYEKGQLDEAITEYREAIRLNKDFPEPHHNLGIALAYKGRLDEAIAEFREALRLKQDYPGAHNNLGAALKIKGRLDEAIAEYQEALRLKKDFPEAHNSLGAALETKGDVNGAIAAYREAVRSLPDDCAHQRIGNIFQARGKLEDAITEYRAGLRAKPDSDVLHYFLGQSLAEQGKLEEAIAELHEAVRLKPDFFMAHNSLAWLLATAVDPKLRKPTQAYEHAKKAVELQPRFPQFWNTLGVAAYRNGNWNEAIAALKKSEELIPQGLASNWLFLAMAHWKLGQQDEARQWYGKAVAWMKFNRVDAELTRFRAEAEQLSGIADKPRAGKGGPRSPRPSRFPVVRFDTSGKGPSKSGTPAVVVLDNTDGLRVLTSAGEQVWSLTGLNIQGQLGGKCVTIDRKRSRIYVGDSVAHRIIALDLQGNKLWQIQQVRVNTLMVDDRTGNLWCSGGPRLDMGETIVFDDGGNEVAAYPWVAIDMAYDPHADAFWLVGEQIIKLTRSGDVAFKVAVDGWCCPSALVNPKDGSIWIAERFHPDVARSKNRLWLRNADGSVRHKIDLGINGLIWPVVVESVPTTGEALFISGSEGLHRASPDGKVRQLGMIKATSISVSPSKGHIWLTTGDAVIRIDDEGNVKAKAPLAASSGQPWIAAY